MKKDESKEERILQSFAYKVSLPILDMRQADKDRMVTTDQKVKITRVIIWVTSTAETRKTHYGDFVETHPQVSGKKW